MREYYGETQEFLGSIIHVEKNTVSYYEHGRHEPSQDTLALIASHYQITIEELLFSDFSGLKGERFCNSVDSLLSNTFKVLFPCISSKKALEADGFRYAWKSHISSYEKIEKNGKDAKSWIESFEGLLDSLFGYLDAWEDEKSREETVANYIGLYLFWETILNHGEPYKTDTAFFSSLSASANSLFQECIDELSPENAVSFFDELHELLIDPEIQVLKKKYREGLILLRGSAKWGRLADYYIALRFLLGRGDNDLSSSLNCTIGHELMKTIADYGNPWAKRLMLCFSSLDNSKP